MELTDGGEIDTINIIILALVVFFNVTDQAFKYQSITDRAIFTLPFILFGILILIFRKSKPLQSIIFLFIAIGTTIDPANASDYSGAIFFIYSYHLIKKSWYAMTLSILSVSCITVRTVANADTIPQALIIIAVFFYIYSIYYFLIYQKPTHKAKIKSLLDKEEILLLDLISSGKTQKEAAAEMNIKHTKAADMIKKIREKTGYDSLYQLFSEQWEPKNSI